MMSNTKMSRSIFLAAVAVFLAVAAFTGCKNDLEKHADETASADGASSDEMTVILPGDVVLTMVKVEAGTFEMSARDGENESNEVSHQATLKRDFYIGRTEVTQAQWKAVTGTDSFSGFNGNDLPVETVSWDEAMEFCDNLNSKGKAPSGWKFTLPTETQWEFAARGGNKSRGYKYSGSDNIDDVAWHWGNSGEKTMWSTVKRNTHPVGKKKANELGLYDMSGNVLEWCLDDWNEDSSKSTAEFIRENNNTDDLRSRRVYRGGCWGDHAASCRISWRDHDSPGGHINYLGFRVALVPESY